MTDLREKLADLMDKTLGEMAKAEARYSDVPGILADAIIAALPGMVKPLEWKSQKYTYPKQIGHHAAPYSIYENPKNGVCVITSGSPYFFGPEHTSDVEAAKAIANAHHRAAIMAALGVEGE